MEENKINLLPGFRFNPFENELINFYLKPKVKGEKLSCNVVEERQLYGPNANPWQVFNPENHPWILSEVSCGKLEKIAYAFVNLTKKAAKSTHVGREQYIKKAGCGTWDGQTKRTEIRDCDGKLIGERRMLVFEINEVSDQVDLSRVGHWRMHEYHLCGVNNDIPNLSNTVLCKITLDHSKKPPIKLLPNRTTRPTKASAPEKNKTNTKKLDVVVCSSSSTNSAVVDTFQGISKSCGAFTTQISHNDGLVSIDSYGPKGEEERCCETACDQTCDDDYLEWINIISDGCSVLEKVENGPMTNDEDWINNTFVSKEGEDGNLYINMSEFEFPSYPEHQDEQPLVDVTNNLGKRKLQPETSYAVCMLVSLAIYMMPEDTSAFLVSLLFGLGPILGGNLLVAFALAFRFQHTLLTALAFGISTVLGAWKPLQLLLSKKNVIYPSHIPTCPWVCRCPCCMFQFIKNSKS